MPGGSSASTPSRAGQRDSHLVSPPGTRDFRQRVLAHDHTVSPGCDIPGGGLQPCQLPWASSSGAAAWNESWNGPPGKRTVLSAAVALSRGIGAGSGHRAREHASCKRQVEQLGYLRHRRYQDRLLGEGEWCLCAIINRLGGDALNACSYVSGLAWTSEEIGICLWTAKIPCRFFSWYRQ
jgi:hypothetical protein